MRRYRILRSAQDPNSVTVDLEFDNAGEAAAFQEKLQALWNRVEGELGLDQRRTSILEAAESKEY